MKTYAQYAKTDFINRKILECAPTVKQLENSWTLTKYAEIVQKIAIDALMRVFVNSVPPCSLGIMIIFAQNALTLSIFGMKK